MRTCLVLATLLFWATGAFAEGTAAPVIGEGYGTPAPIEAGFDPGTVDRSYLNVPNTKDFRLSLAFKDYPVWHPDGKRIYFTDKNNIYIIPATGGKPTLIYEGYYIYPFQGTRYVVDQGVGPILGFSSDGKKLYFTGSLIDPGSGTTITISEGVVRSVMGMISALECLDLTTGTSTVVTRNISGYTLSRSGRLLGWCDKIKQTSRIQNLSTGESWELPVNTNSMAFTWDETGLIYFSEGQLFRIPIRGGQASQISHFTDDLFAVVTLINIRGEWALFTYRTHESYTDSSTVPGGGTVKYQKWVIRQVVNRLNTSELYDATPFSKTIDAKGLQLSPDGSRICYFRTDFATMPKVYELYIKPLSLPVQEKELAVNASAPAAFGIAGNSPNPFNPSTAIEFSLPAAGNAGLAVYSVTGQKVRTLLDGPLAAGSHRAVWNGRDDSGAAVSSGVYFARLRAGANTAVHRMMFMK